MVLVVVSPVFHLRLYVPKPGAENTNGLIDPKRRTQFLPGFRNALLQTTVIIMRST